MKGAARHKGTRSNLMLSVDKAPWNEKEERRKRMEKESKIRCCPRCDKECGPVTLSTYYCSHCDIEFNKAGRMFHITADGKLVDARTGARVMTNDGNKVKNACREKEMDTF